MRDAQMVQLTAQQQQTFRGMLKWLSPKDFSAPQSAHGRQAGTGQWFTSSAEFRTWSEGPRTTLFCPGIPGAGKTTMAQAVLDHLSTTRSSINTGIASLFCDYKAQAEQTPLNLLSSVLEQLIRARPDLAQPVYTSLYKNRTGDRSLLPIAELLSALRTCCSSHLMTYIIIDALDECTTKQNSRDTLIRELRALQVGTDVRLFFTSRPVPDVTAYFLSSATLEVKAAREDVRRYIEGQMDQLPPCIRDNTNLQEDVLSRIIEAVDGM